MSPRSLEYFILRACERLGMTEADFHRLDFSGQVRLLAFDRLRTLEESHLR